MKLCDLEHTARWGELRTFAAYILRTWSLDRGCSFISTFPARFALSTTDAGVALAPSPLERVNVDQRALTRPPGSSTSGSAVEHLTK